MRLKKNPELDDYVVEATAFFPDGGRRQEFDWSNTRAVARSAVTGFKNRGFDRVRVFRVKFTLVSDSKPKGRKK